MFIVPLREKKIHINRSYGLTWAFPDFFCISPQRFVGNSFWQAQPSLVVCLNLGSTNNCFGGCPLQGRMFNNISALAPLDASSSLSPQIVTTKNVSRHCKEQKQPHLPFLIENHRSIRKPKENVAHYLWWKKGKENANVNKELEVLVELGFK